MECSIQVAQKPSGEELNRVLGKFKEECVETVKKLILNKIKGEPKEIEYEKIFATAYISSEDAWRRQLEKNGIKLLTFRNLIEEIVRTIDEWKEKRRTVIKGETLEFPWITLPACYWMLYLIDVLKSPLINMLKLDSKKPCDEK